MTLSPSLHAEMVLVPREPTPEMCAAADEQTSYDVRRGTVTVASNIYRAMLAASPQSTVPPAQEWLKEAMRLAAVMAQCHLEAVMRASDADYWRLARKHEDAKAALLAHLAARIDAQEAKDTQRGRYMVENAEWIRHEGRTYMQIRVPDGYDLSCRATRAMALDAAIAAQAAQPKDAE